MRRLIFLAVLLVMALVLVGLVGQQKPSKGIPNLTGCKEWLSGKPGFNVTWPPNVLSILRTGEKDAIVIARWNKGNTALFFHGSWYTDITQDTCPMPCKYLEMMSVTMQRPHGVPTSMPQDTPAVKVSVPPDMLDVSYTEEGGFAVKADWEGGGKEGKSRTCMNHGVASKSAESIYCPGPCLYRSHLTVAKIK